MNWQNVNADPPWESIDNWYWRSLEVCIGITAACIPALRPGYRTVVAGINAYISRRTAHKITDAAPNDAGHPSSGGKALEAAAQAVSFHTDCAARYGVGEEGFAMNELPGDTGIKKTLSIDIDSSRAGQSSRSIVQGGVGREFGREVGSKDFV